MEDINVSVFNFIIFAHFSLFVNIAKHLSFGMPLQHHTRGLGLYFVSLSAVFYVINVNYISFGTYCQIFSIKTERNFPCWTVAFVRIRSFTNEFGKIVNLNQRIIRCKGYFRTVWWKGEIINPCTVTVYDTIWNRLEILSVQYDYRTSWVSKLTK